MQVQPIALGTILKNYKLRVPPNQREYSWDDKRVQTLFKDWASAINEPEYFLGAVVAVTREGGALEIVDGQQRLATTAIFLAVVRDFLKKHDEPEIAASIDREFLVASTADRRETEPKLQLNLADNEYFRAKITGENPIPDKDSHHLIEAAFASALEQVEAIVSSHDRKKYGDVLNTVWVEFVQNRAMVILLEVPSSANAFRMFETLNDRGLRTTQADLIKSRLFHLAGEARSTEAHDKWAAMLGALEALDDDEASTVTFLRHVLNLKRGHLREKDLYDNVQEEAKSSGTALSLLDSFERLAGDYVALFNPESEKWRGYPGQTTEALATLKILDIQSMWPLMLAVAVKFDKNQASKAFRMFVAWEVRFLVVGATLTGGSIEVPLARAAKAVFDGEIKAADELAARLANTIPDDEKFRASFAVAASPKPEMARYYLRALERVAKGQPDPWFVPNDNQEVINLEHVLPKKPLDNWPQFEPIMVKTDSRRIGNLALLKNQDNRSLGSAGFEEKRAVLRESPYVLTSQIAEVADWDHAAIGRRQALLADLALKAWPL